LNGVLWRLKVYPNGNGVAKNNYLSVFLEMQKVNSFLISERELLKVKSMNIE
jgi:hypothetical protein